MMGLEVGIRITSCFRDLYLLRPFNPFVFSKLKLCKLSSL